MKIYRIPDRASRGLFGFLFILLVVFVEVFSSVLELSLLSSAVSAKSAESLSTQIIPVTCEKKRETFRYIPLLNALLQIHATTTFCSFICFLVNLFANK